MKGWRGTGTRGGGSIRRGGEGGVKPITLKLAQIVCPWVSLGGDRENGAPMPCLLSSLKLECEKLASEKTEMQRHYVMVRGLAC